MGLLDNLQPVPKICPTVIQVMREYIDTPSEELSLGWKDGMASILSEAIIMEDMEVLETFVSQSGRPVVRTEADHGAMEAFACLVHIAIIMLDNENFKGE